MLETNLDNGATLSICSQSGQRNTELDDLTRRPASLTLGMGRIHRTTLPIYLQIDHRGTELEDLG